MGVRFLQLCTAPDPVQALRYLQEYIAPIVDSNHVEEANLLATLSARIFRPDPTLEDGYTTRSELYDRLIEYFPENMKQPIGSLVDYVPYS
jgi:hypothetical protein